MGDEHFSDRISTIESLPMRPAGRVAGVGPLAPIREIWERRDLVYLLTKREIRARYKDSSLGIAWSLLRPLAQLLVYYFALGKLIGASRGVPDFALFVFIGLTGWTFYAEVVQKAAQSIVHNGGLVKKVYLPREVFPLASLGSGLFTFLVQAIILVIAIIALGAFPDVRTLPYAVAGFALIGVIALGLGILLAAVNVYFRDVEHLVEVAFVVLFWASPVVYSYRLVHDQIGGSLLESAYLANPVTLGIMGMQRGLWAAGADPAVGGWPANLPWLIVLGFVIGLGFLAFAHWVFNRVQGNFAQEV